MCRLAEGTRGTPEVGADWLKYMPAMTLNQKGVSHVSQEIPTPPGKAKVLSHVTASSHSGHQAFMKPWGQLALEMVGSEDMNVGTTASLFQRNKLKKHPSHFELSGQGTLINE